MSTTTSNAKSAALTANTASSLSWPQRFDWILVTNLDASHPVYLTTDGTTATVTENGADVVPAGTTVTFANRGLKPVPSQSGPGATAVSLISAGTGPVVVAPQ